jgi:hypothetical protein
MTKAQAVDRARRQAHRNRQTVYVLWSVEEMDPPRKHYHTATEETLETFFCGVDPLMAIDPDGSVDGY